MKKINFILSLLFIAMSLSLTSCGKDDDDDDDNTPPTRDEMLMDKWWYNMENQGRGNNLFGSDGTVQMTWPVPATGTFAWGPNDSMYVSMPGSAAFTIWFQKIEVDYIEYWPTFEPVGNIYKFSTTEP